MAMRFISGLITSRRYNALVAISSLFLCAWVSSVYHFLPYPVVFGSSVVFLVFDASVRSLIFGIDGWIDFLNVVLTAALVVCSVFDFIFSSVAYVNIQPVLSGAYAIRAAVAVQHFVLRGDAIQPMLRKLTIADTSNDKKSSRDLDICYITSRIIALGRPSLSSPEHSFLESKYSNFLRHLPILEPGIIPSLSSLATVIEGAVFHLFCNPVNVVSVSAPSGDMNAVLVICALLLRTGAVPYGSATQSLQIYLSQRYVIAPHMSRIVSKNQLSQLRIFERIITRAANRNLLESISASAMQLWQLKRVVISQLDASVFLDLRLTVLDVESGKILAQNVSPSSSGTSLTFLCPTGLKSDSLFVFTESGSGSVVFKLYVSSTFHFERTLASQSSYHYVVSSDDCDHWTRRFSNVSARIEITASTDESDFAGGMKPGSDFIDKELLALPPGVSRRDSSCLIV